MAEHVPGVWEAEVAAYDAGLAGSRRLMEFEMGLVDAPPADLLATAAAQPHDPGFVPFVRRAQAAERADRDRVGRVRLLHRAGARGARRGRAAGRHRPDDVLGSARVRSRSRTATRRAASAGPASATGCSPTRPPGGRSCSSATARATATPRATATSSGPSGPSSGSASRRAGRSTRWTEFAEIDAWLADVLAAWRADPATLPGPAAHPFFCGPEVWGEGLTDPPPGAWPPPRE